MAKKSSLHQKLTDEERRELDRLISEGRLTYEQITAWLNEKGHAVSKSAVHRYGQDFERIAQDIRLSREMSRAIASELGAMPDGDAGRLAIESLQALLLRARMQLSTGDELDIEAFAALSRAAKDLQSALKSNVETELKIRDRVAREAAEVASKGMAAKGISAETVEEIRAKILGLGRAA